ncbi:MAG: hypothetical protein LBE13_07545 [Bacteroidales bacterium]|jgi:hypothetical protein|nr:hypothetical protein [Bacteroidales bacterium]
MKAEDKISIEQPDEDVHAGIDNYVFLTDNSDRRITDNNNNCISIKDKEYLTDLYNNIFDSLLKDEDRFETKITYITSGSIVLFFTYIMTSEIAFNNKFTGMLGIIFLILSLLSNLASYLIGKIWMRSISKKLFYAIERNTEPEEEPDKMIYSTNKKIDALNWISTILLFIGIAFITIFIFINN